MLCSHQQLRQDCNAATPQNPSARRATDCNIQRRRVLEKGRASRRGRHQRRRWPQGAHSRFSPLFLCPKPFGAPKTKAEAKKTIFFLVWGSGGCFDACFAGVSPLVRASKSDAACNPTRPLSALVASTPVSQEQQGPTLEALKTIHKTLNPKPQTLSPQPQTPTPWPQPLNSQQPEPSPLAVAPGSLGRRAPRRL